VFFSLSNQSSALLVPHHVLVLISLTLFRWYNNTDTHVYASEFFTFFLLHRQNAHVSSLYVWISLLFILFLFFVHLFLLYDTPVIIMKEPFNDFPLKQHNIMTWRVNGIIGVKKRKANNTIVLLQHAHSIHAVSIIIKRPF